MSVAADLSRRSAPHGTVVVTDLQRDGRGRQGRNWVAASGCALLTSWILRLPFLHGDIGALSPLVALGLVRAIQSLAPEAPVSLKWPNDVLIDDRKVAGILLASHGSGRERVAIAGIGVNVRPAAIPDGVDGAALSEWAADIDTDCLLDALAEHLEGVVRSFATTGTISRTERDEIDASLAWCGQLVTLVSDDGERDGVIRGIDQHGSLLLQAGGQRHATAIRIGEVVRGPRKTHEIG